MLLSQFSILELHPALRLTHSKLWLQHTSPTGRPVYGGARQRGPVHRAHDTTHPLGWTACVKARRKPQCSGGFRLTMGLAPCRQVRRFSGPTAAHRRSRAVRCIVATVTCCIRALRTTVPLQLIRPMHAQRCGHDDQQRPFVGVAARQRDRLRAPRSIRWACAAARQGIIVGEPL